MLEKNENQIKKAGKNGLLLHKTQRKSKISKISKARQLSLHSYCRYILPTQIHTKFSQVVLTQTFYNCTKMPLGNCSKVRFHLSERAPKRFHNWTHIPLPSSHCSLHFSPVYSSFPAYQYTPLATRGRTTPVLLPLAFPPSRGPK